jgi:hypothetical protein
MLVNDYKYVTFAMFDNLLGFADKTSFLDVELLILLLLLLVD